MLNIKLVIAYDGSGYKGWQKNSSGPAIETKLEDVIERILQHRTPLQASGRTDAGVHAQGQVVNFFTLRENLDLGKFAAGINRLLPSDIVVISAEKMPLSFHPTIDCIGKEYRYYICTGSFQYPVHRSYSWHVPVKLDFDRIEQGISLLKGKHDFRAFCNLTRTGRYKDYIREIILLRCESLSDGRYFFRVEGDRFLYKMVRNIVGTLIDIGKGKIDPEELSEILLSKKREKIGVTAPAHGLFLHRIIF